MLVTLYSGWCCAVADALEMNASDFARVLILGRIALLPSCKFRYTPSRLSVVDVFTQSVVYMHVHIGA